MRAALKEGERGLELVGLVAFSPGVLVEGLDDGVGLVERGGEVWRRRKEKTSSQSARWAAISRMLHLRGAGRCVDLSVGEVGGECVDACGGGGEHGDGVLAVKELGVRV